MKPTFNQIAALVICLTCLTVLCFALFIASKNPNEGLIIGAMISGFTGSAGYFIGSTHSSQTKDATIASNTSQMIDALANSTPLKNS